MLKTCLDLTNSCAGLALRLYLKITNENNRHKTDQIIR